MSTVSNGAELTLSVRRVKPSLFQDVNGPKCSPVTGLVWFKEGLEFSHIDSVRNTTSLQSDCPVVVDLQDGMWTLMR